MTVVRDFLAEIRRFIENPLVVLSLGAGVQSSTLALMCATGYLPFKIFAAIFADTQAEPPEVYRWLKWLETQLPFPIFRVTRGNLAVDGLEFRRSRAGADYWKAAVPMFVKNADGSKGKLLRKCTAEYKVRQIIKQTRALVGAPTIRTWQRAYNVHREAVTTDAAMFGASAPTPTSALVWRVPENTPPLVRSLIGISADEFQRAKPSREPWIQHVHPLLDADITREDCKRWMRDRGYPDPPRSACFFCPYHSDAEWSRMRREDPATFAAALQWEAQAQAQAQAQACKVTRGIPYLHSSLKPLAMVPFDAAKQKGLFDEECAGMCGV